MTFPQGRVELTREQIMGLAPDASSLSAGRGLADVRHWRSLGRSEHALWGECQGSGANPYQTRVDLREPAYKCSCPSRKFPCKHTLGLMLLAATMPNAVSAAAMPPWVEEWIAKRDAPAVPREKRVAEEPIDEATAAKKAAAAGRRIQARSERIDAGVEALSTFLEDLVRGGILNLTQQPYSFWDRVAARLVDAQAPGLASAIRELGGIVAGGGAEWQPAFLRRLARLSLLLEGWKRRTSLPAEHLADVTSAVGIPALTDALAELPSESDLWLVLGQTVDDTSAIRSQRTWLMGLRSQRTALVLQFAPQQHAFDLMLTPGTSVPAELVFYPSAAPLRVHWRTGERAQPWQPWSPRSIEAAQAEWTTLVAASPLLERTAFVVGPVTPACMQDRFWLVDASEAAWPLHVSDADGWRLMAMSGGRPIEVAGEFDGIRFVPLSTWVDGRFIGLMVRREAA